MRTRLVGVIGSGKIRDPDEARRAEELGAALAREGWGLVCGGLKGVMESAARGAVHARGEARHPPVIGLLPGYDVEDGNPYLDVVLPTGLGHARNALVAAGAEAVVCVGGSMGALSEVALARKVGRPVLALASTGGTAALVAKVLPSVVAVGSVDEAVARLREIFA